MCTFVAILDKILVMEMTNRQQEIILDILEGSNSLSQLSESESLGNVARRTIQRDIGELNEQGVIQSSGEARATVYDITPQGRVNISISENRLENFFSREDRPAVRFDFGRLDILGSTSLFTKPEQKELDNLNGVFQQKLETAPADIIRREKERITIELSWKSSQFEGNTYTLLETESLLKEGVAATGKTQEETTMVLNHKKALDFAEANQELFANKLNVQTIIELHKLIVDGLGISHGLRDRLVGITGSTYKPLENKFQIEDELKRLCDVINSKDSVYEKSLIAFIYICYLQSFNDGNKRTARILANAIQNAHRSFPLSLRATDVNTYKLATLAYYELGILGNVKDVFIEQARYAAENYAI